MKYYDSEIAKFDTKKEALAVRDWIVPQTYVLNFGEYESPTYSVRKMKNEDKYVIYKETYYLPGTINASRSHFLREDEIDLDGFLPFDETEEI